MTNKNLASFRGLLKPPTKQVDSLLNKKTTKEEPLVSIVTPVYNGEKYLEDTIQCIINQTYDNIEYIIIDGGSTDKTLDIIKKYEDRTAYWMSEQNRGMYDGINKGFEMATGEIFAWLNADDKYYHSAVEIVVRIFNKYSKNIEWVTGIPSIYDKNGLIVRVCYPASYSRRFIRVGLYRDDILVCIQRESTFWRRSLWEKAGGINFDLQFAGDYDLWVRFSKHSHLHVIPTTLGGFRKHQTQKSNDMEKYYKECGVIKNIKFNIFWKIIRVPIILLSIFIPYIEIERKRCCNNEKSSNYRHYRTGRLLSGRVSAF